MKPCACGCGKLANKRFCKGHRASGPWSTVIEDRGYATPCHVWLGSKSSNGYGIYGRGDERTTAHRYAYQREHGPLPKTLYLDHLCRQRDCVNPEHLEPVTPAENVRRGVLCTLADEVVREIRSAVGVQHEIAARFGVSQCTVSRIKSGRTRVAA